MPEPFKGIALFTPGGDLIYCLDPDKQARWHVHLCAALQEIFGLPEPPYFLVPGYTATIDCWLEPGSMKLETAAEIYPAVQRYQCLLNAVFDTKGLLWQVAPWQDEYCNRVILETYRSRFRQLWEEKDLIIRLDSHNPTAIDRSSRTSNDLKSPLSPQSYLSTSRSNNAYILRLFVSGNNLATNKILQNIYQILEQNLSHPYTLKVVDITKNPELAEANHITAIPTLVRVWPKPIEKIVGEFDDLSQIARIIGGRSSWREEI